MSNLDPSARVRILNSVPGSGVTYAIAAFFDPVEERIVAAVYHTSLGTNQFQGHYAFLRSDWFLLKPVVGEIRFAHAEMSINYGSYIDDARRDKVKPRKSKKRDAND